MIIFSPNFDTTATVFREDITSADFSGSTGQPRTGQVARPPSMAGVLLMATRNPASTSPVKGIGSEFIPLFTVNFMHPRWLALGFLNHQQYFTQTWKILKEISIMYLSNLSHVDTKHRQTSPPTRPG